MMELLACPCCQHPLWDPVTVPCGHTFCKRCLQGAARGRCQVCRTKLKISGEQELRCNTLLSDLLDKCLDPHTKINRITRDLRHLIAQQKYEEAGKVACKAVTLAPQDVPLRILRSQVYVSLKQFPESLREADVICNLQPQDPDGFYRKGVALLNMEKKEEALIHFQHCMKLRPQFPEARQEIEQLEDNEKTSLTEPPGNGMTKSADINQEQGKRKEPDEPAPPETYRLSKHFKLTDHEEDGTQKICPYPSLKDLLSLSDVECSLCIRMFLEPVTTPCGHTFCKECLLRCLDHQPYCPLCKQSLREYLRVGGYAVTALLMNLMETIFPSEMADRKQVHLTEIAELSNLVSNVPIFVCTVAFPGVPCPLHVFEPRYRLMMRRCLETGTKSFGMCLYESGKSFADYGCMLEILHLDYLPDGRSLVETIGKRRFRVLQRGQLDGYHKAEIEYLSDMKVEGEELDELQRLHDMVYQQLEECFSQQRGSLPRRIFMHHTSPPPKEDSIQASPDGPFWCWWLLSVLPLDPVYQTLIISMTSLKERLFHLKHILSVFLQSPS
ncbi:LON peptidase N-terminal domain and RING finger protein 1-like isoform X3 [Rana temporaria]|uniref:LON peptidase N-terminal domain and RING finger protein 1-like isoform X3 n=1 Tax=Rana temporaria TaxID=8407 RepID=UPI001AACEF37|nr:LON peptidase N-terminal domain and RING finger protein 1-like isoform X3 [Rana temporaria]